MKNLKPGFFPAIIWLIISTVLLTIPGSSFPKEDWLDKIWVDKWVHLVMFTVMVLLWCWAMLRFPNEKQNRVRIFFLIAILGIGYGVAMEFVQDNLVPNRSFDVGDIIADAAGCTLGLILSRRWYIKK